MLRSYLFFLAVFALLGISYSQMYMDLSPGDMRCVGQELDEEDTARFIFGATFDSKKKTKGSQKLSVIVTDPDGDEIIDERIIIGNRPKEVVKNVEGNGVYEMCFELEGGSHPVRVFFHVDFKSRSSNFLEKLSTIARDDIPGLEAYLKEAEGLLNEVSSEIDFARRQEAELKKSGESASSRIQWFSIFSIVILASTSIWQLIYLRRYFTSKKLL